MSIWIEIHCNSEDAIGPALHHYLDDTVCSSADNSNPGILTNDNRQAIFNGLIMLAKEANKQGWKRTVKGWFCPHCIKRGRHK